MECVCKTTIDMTSIAIWTDELTGYRYPEAHGSHKPCFQCKREQYEREYDLQNKAFTAGISFGRTEEAVADLMKSQEMLILSALEDIIQQWKDGQ